MNDKQKKADLFWIDTHCHLDFDVFAPDLKNIITRALEQNVLRQITISTQMSHAVKLKKIAEYYPSVFWTIGTHPCHAHEEAEQKIGLKCLLEETKHPKCVGIGEAGLDYHYDKQNMAIQKKTFLMHIAAARETQLPLIIHSRDADEDMASILREEMRCGAFPFILHCYSSGIELAKTGLSLGGYISFSGISTFKNAPIVREVAQLTPPNKILIETDAPYLAPVPFRGKVNEPSFVVKTGEFLADFLKIAAADFACQTTENAFSIFKKLTPP